MSVMWFKQTLEDMGSDVIFHREEGGTLCPCITAQGFRDPEWHLAHPSDPVCNETGHLAGTVTEFSFKASMQPAFFRGSTRFAERQEELLGIVQEDDFIGILPVDWNGHVIDLEDWSSVGEDYLLYDGRRFTVVSNDMMPDIDGNPRHHQEAGLRLIKADRPI